MPASGLTLQRSEPLGKVLMNDNRLTLTLPANERWLPIAEHASRRYARLLEFSQTLEDMIAFSVLEACEELLRRGKEASVSSEYSLSLDLHHDAVWVEISYNGKIPLNPHLTEDYEVPDLATGLDGMAPADLDSLWLHLVKKQMDRVFFHVKGGVHVLKMVKYRRSEGQELRLWALGLSPKLKEKLHVEWIERDGHLQGGLLQDLESQNVLRLGAKEAFVVRRMDGKTSLYEIYLECVEATGPFAPQLITSLFEALEGAGMLAHTEPERKASKLRAVLNKILNPTFTIPRADAVVEAIYRLVRPLVSPAGVVLCLLIGFSGIIPMVQTHPFHEISLIGLEQAVLCQPWILIVLYFLMMLMVAVHELGHAVVCKHYGGRVPRLGVMFYLASFIFFCDTTSSWNFPRKSQRIMVSLGGPLTTFAFLGAGLWAAAYYVGTGSIWEQVWLMFCLMCFFGLVMNFNPFIRMDAYYMLMDWTGIPNLRQRSFAFLQEKILGFFRGKSARKEAEPEPQKRIILLLYGVVGAVMTVVFFIFPLVYYGRMLIEGSPHKGRIVMGIVVVSLALVRLSHTGYMKYRSLREREYKVA